MVDEDELVALDAGETFVCQIAGAGDCFRVEEFQRNTVFGAQAEGDALEAAGFGVEGFRFG